MAEEAQHLIENDQILKEIILTIPAITIENTDNVFHDLMSCVFEQQIHYRSTKKVFQKMLEKANVKVLTPDNFDEFENKAFNNLKLSTKKYETALNIIEYWNKDDIKWQDQSDEIVRTKLSEIKGIGNWTIDMILIYTLNRPNIFSYDDYHIKQIMTSLYKLNPNSRLKAQMKEVTEQWKPYKSIAFKYLIEWKKFNKMKKK